MTVTVVCNADLEKFLAACRLALLQAAETAPDPLLGFACALAHQCLNNEYVYATTGDEEERAPTFARSAGGSAGRRRGRAAAVGRDGRQLFSIARDHWGGRPAGAALARSVSMRC